MSIQIEPHTLVRARERGASEDEIVDTINSGIQIAAKSGRIGKAKVFKFNSIRDGKYFEEKKIEVFYVIENQDIVTVTVYVFYGKF